MCSGSAQNNEWCVQWCKQDVLCLFGHFASHAAACLCRGITANVVLLIYYSAPLTTVKEVLVSRSSSSLYWPLCMMNVLNGLLWVGYGRVSNAVLWNACACSFHLAHICQACHAWLFVGDWSHVASALQNKKNQK